MARRRKPKQSDNIKYVLIGAAALIVLFLVFNVAPTGKFTVPATCEDTAGTDLIDTYSTEETCILTWTDAVPAVPATDAQCLDYAGNDITDGSVINNYPYDTLALCSNGEDTNSGDLSSSKTWHCEEMDTKYPLCCVDPYGNAIARYTDPVTEEETQYWAVDGSQCQVTWIPETDAVPAVPATCEDTVGTDLIDTYSTEETCILTWNAAYTINQPPTITAIDDISLVEGSTLPSITVDATDPNNDDTLTYSITVGISPLETQLLVPAFTLTIDSSSGAITGTLPDISQDTIYRVTVTVTDDATSPGSDSEYFDITVLSDADSDGVADGNDNCPNVANSDQANFDGDTLGDACDDDVDGDTVDNTLDNCPNVANSDQANFDGDTLGDACDDDVDGDGVDETDNADNCPNTTPGASVDEDGCSDSQLDDNADNDNDGVRNGDDLCQGTPSEVLSGTTNDDGVDDNVNSVGCPDTDGDDIYDNLDTVWSLTEDTPDATTEEEVQVISHSLENDGTFSMNLQAATTDTEALTSLTDSLVLVKVTYYDLQTNEEISSTIYTSQVSIGETSTEAFSISVPQTSTAVRYIATVNVWSGMIGTVNWQPYSEKIELRGEFHP